MPIGDRKIKLPNIRDIPGIVKNVPGYVKDATTGKLVPNRNAPTPTIQNPYNNPNNLPPGFVVDATTGKVVPLVKGGEPVVTKIIEHDTQLINAANPAPIQYTFDGGRVDYNRNPPNVEGATNPPAWHHLPLNQVYPADDFLKDDFANAPPVNNEPYSPEGLTNVETGTTGTPQVVPAPATTQPVATPQPPIIPPAPEIAPQEEAVPTPDTSRIEQVNQAISELPETNTTPTTFREETESITPLREQFQESIARLQELAQRQVPLYDPVSDYENIINNRGLETLQKRENDLNRALQSYSLDFQSRVIAEQNSPIPQGDIDRNVANLQSIYNSRVATIQSEIQLVQNEIATERAFALTMVELGVQSYEIAVNAYDKEYNRQLALLQIQAELSLQDLNIQAKQQELAFAQQETLLNLLSKAFSREDIQYKDLPDSIRAQFSKVSATLYGDPDVLPAIYDTLQNYDVVLGTDSNGESNIERVGGVYDCFSEDRTPGKCQIFMDKTTGATEQRFLSASNTSPATPQQTQDFERQEAIVGNIEDIYGISSLPDYTLEQFEDIQRGLDKDVLNNPEYQILNDEGNATGNYNTDKVFDYINARVFGLDLTSAEVFDDFVNVIDDFQDSPYRTIQHIKIEKKKDPDTDKDIQATEASEFRKGDKEYEYIIDAEKTSDKHQGRINLDVLLDRFQENPEYLAAFNINVANYLDQRGYSSLDDIWLGGVDRAESDINAIGKLAIETYNGYLRDRAAAIFNKTGKVEKENNQYLRQHTWVPRTLNSFEVNKMKDRVLNKNLPTSAQAPVGAATLTTTAGTKVNANIDVMVWKTELEKYDWSNPAVSDTNNRVDDALAVIQGESSGVPTRVNDGSSTNSVEYSVGLFQINIGTPFGSLEAERKEFVRDALGLSYTPSRDQLIALLMNPQNNIQVAHALYVSKDNYFSPTWSAATKLKIS